MIHIPTELKLHSKSRVLEISFEGEQFMLPCEYLRVYSPSAEVKGHGPGQEVLQIGKEDVNIVSIQPIGNYAVQFVYSDSHNSGIYSWDYLYELGEKRQENWQDYLQRLKQSNTERSSQENDQYLVWRSKL